MDIVTTSFLSGRIAYLIIAPLLREISAVLLAFSISKDCKARDNGSGVLWGIFTLITPVLSGVIYLIYSRYLTKRDGKTLKDKNKIKSAKKLAICSGIVYLISLILVIASVITMAASGLAAASKDDFSDIDAYNYYDMNGTQYDSADRVPLYDENGNKYELKKVPDGVNWYAYFDRNGNQYELEQSYISKDGYFYYDSDYSLTESDELYYYDKHFYDSQGNEYAHIDDCAFWDSNGNICIRYNGNRVRYAFDG